MAKDVRALREEAAEATASGKYKRALAAYLELERLEPRDAQWAKRAAETYRRLGNNKHAIEAFERSADRYAQNGFLVQAIAVCKLVLQIDPQHQEALRRLATMNEQLGAGPTRAAGMAENNPNLHENPNVQAIRRPPTYNPRSKPPSSRIPVIRDAPSAPVRSATGSTAVPKPHATGSSSGVPSAATSSVTSQATGIPRTITPLPAKPIQTQPIGTPRPAVRPLAQQPHPQPTPVPTQQTQPIPGLQRLPSSPSSQPQPQAPKPVGVIPQTRPSQPMPAVARTTSPSNLASRTRTSSSPVVAVARTKSKPIALPEGSAIDKLELTNEVPESRRRDESNPGVHIIPIDIPIDDTYEVSEQEQEQDETFDYDRVSDPIIEIEPPDEPIEAEISEATELELDDIEEIPLPEPLYMGAAAHRALQATPLFAGLPGDALEALVENLTLVHLEPDEVLFHEGDPGDALYVIVEGEVSVQAEGPPRVEMARLGAGSFIGEVALMTDQPRSATVTAVQGAELLRIDRITLSRVLANHGDVLRAVLRFVRDRLVDRWMRTSPLFRPFDEQQRAELAGRFNFLEIEDGTRLIEANTKPDGLYIVLAGSFAVNRDDSTLAQLGAGELIGETALLSGSVFKSNVTARGKSLALHLPAAAFREMIMTHPHVLEYIGEHAEQSRRLQIL